MRHYYNSVSLCPAYSAGRKSLEGGGQESSRIEKRERQRLMAKDKVRERGEGDAGR